MKTSWEEKAHRVIGIVCFEAWKAANTKTDGTRYRKPRPYSPPELAQRLVSCLDMKDRNQAEIEAKRIFLSYEGLEAVRA